MSDSLKKALDSNALDLLKKIKGATPNEAVDIFKVVTAYYLGSEKTAAKPEKAPPPEAGKTFSSILTAVNGKEAGGHA